MVGIEMQANHPFNKGGHTNTRNTMKSYLSFLAIPAIVGILSISFSQGYLDFFSRTDAITAELGPLLSPEAKIIFPTDNATLFAELTRRYIYIHDPQITTIVQVAIEADVPLVINYAKKTGRTVLPAAARHGWGTSLQNVRNAIMIDLNAFSHINIDATANTMTVGGAVVTGNVMAAVHAAGKQAATGICDCVGLLGATLGGGHGRSQGLHGLMADNLLSANLVLPSGETVTVSNTSHQDLFWALRGAGHNFGVVTEAVYRIYDQVNGGMLFNADLTYAPEHIDAIFTAINKFNELEQTAETSIFTLFVPQPGAKPLVIFSFSSFDPTDKAVAKLNAGFGHIPHLTRTDSTIPWDKINILGALGIAESACTSLQRKNAFGVDLIRYDVPTVRAVYDSYAEFMVTNPTADGTAVLFESYPVHAIQAIDEAETAYAHRKEKHIILLLGGYTDASMDSVVVNWLGETAALLHSTSGFEKPAVYLNYAQDTEGFGAMYGYEEWRQERLKALKRKYDPDGMFSGYHPIPRD